MPVNIIQGNTASFTVEFLDSLGALSVPSGGQLVVSYINVSTLASTSQTIPLSQSGSFFTGSWNSALSTTGLVPWSVYAAGSTATAAQSDAIRVIDP